MAGWVVEVSGLKQVLNALAEVDKKAAKRVTDAIASAAKGVAAEASYRTPGSNPISNWGAWNQRGRDLSYSGSAAAGGMKVRRNGFRRRGVSAGASWDVVQTNAAGAIFELVGKGSTPFVEAISGRYRGKNPRSLIPAYYAAMPESLADSIRDQILDEARKAGLV